MIYHSKFEKYFNQITFIGCIAILIQHAVPFKTHNDFIATGALGHTVHGFAHRSYMNFEYHDTKKDMFPIFTFQESQ